MDFGKSQMLSLAFLIDYSACVRGRDGTVGGRGLGEMWSAAGTCNDTLVI